MELIKLSVQTREPGKPNKVRQSGMIPVVLYGSGKDNLHLSVSASDFIKVFRQTGYNTIIELDIDGKNKENILIYEVTRNPITDNFQHVDMMRVDMTKEVTAAVPLVFVGVSKAVKDLGGILVENMDELQITCLPANLPKEYNVDVSSLNTFDDAIYVRDLEIGEGLKIEDDETRVVVTVIPPRSDEELASLDEEVVEDVEGVETEEKGEESDEDEVKAEDGDKKEEKKEEKTEEK